MMRYRCFDCDALFEVDAAPDDVLEDRAEACPRCGTRAGVGHPRCHRCGARLEVALPHWHRPCDLHRARCGACGHAQLSLCVC
jgi:DNA-directed RNA polymerase subunit RPC12/RpoP